MSDATLSATLSAEVEGRRILLSRLTTAPAPGSLVYCRRRRKPRRWLFGLVTQTTGFLVDVRRADGHLLTYRLDKLYTEQGNKGHTTHDH